MLRPPHRSGPPQWGAVRQPRWQPVLAALVAILLFPLPGRAGEASPLDQSDAVVLNITEGDLNRILEATLRTKGGPAFEGTKSRVSKGISDLHYRALVSEPALELEADGRMRLTLDLSEAKLSIGRIERRIAGRTMRCEDTGVRIDPARQVDVMLALQLSIEDNDLRIVPREISITDLEKKARLIKPARCTNNILPEWFLWWIGKPRLRKRLANLDDLVLARIRESTARLNDGQGLLRGHWRLDPGDESGNGTELHLYPQSLHTEYGSLLIGLASSDSRQDVSSSGALDWAAPLASRSFLGVSESLLNSVIEALLGSLSERPKAPGGNLRKLLGSPSMYALMPGLRGIGSTDGIVFSYQLRTPPRLELLEVDGSGMGDEFADGGSRAMLRIAVSGLEVHLWEAGEERTTPLGALYVDSGRIGVVPYLNVLGGVSFELVENEWELSSSGIEMNEALIAATLQEMVFGEVFETRFVPVHREALRIGNAAFHPRYFHTVAGYLIIELTEF